MPPQITCPHCGSTINLENRKEVDFEKIMYALDKSPRTFTELLTITNLPRKTLSLRLKELCSSGSIVKDGGYHLNSSIKPANRVFGKRNGNGKMNGTILHFGKNVQWIPAALIVCLVVIAFGSAFVLSPPQPGSSPVPAPRDSITTPIPAAVVYVDSLPSLYQVGDIMTLRIMISGVTDLYGWQAGMIFNPATLQCIVEPAPPNVPTDDPTTALVEGDFLKQNGATLWFVGTMNEDSGVIGAHGSTLTSPAAPVSGSGILATVTFKVISRGTGDIHLTDVILIGSDGETQIPVYVAT